MLQQLALHATAPPADALSKAALGPPCAAARGGTAGMGHWRLPGGMVAASHQCGPAGSDLTLHWPCCAAGAADAPWHQLPACRPACTRASPPAGGSTAPRSRRNRLPAPHNPDKPQDSEGCKGKALPLAQRTVAAGRGTCWDASGPEGTDGAEGTDGRRVPTAQRLYSNSNWQGGPPLPRHRQQTQRRLSELVCGSLWGCRRHHRRHPRTAPQLWGAAPQRRGRPAACTMTCAATWWAGHRSWVGQKRAHSKHPRTPAQGASSGARSAAPHCPQTANGAVWGHQRQCVCGRVQLPTRAPVGTVEYR